MTVLESAHPTAQAQYDATAIALALAYEQAVATAEAVKVAHVEAAVAMHAVALNMADITFTSSEGQARADLVAAGGGDFVTSGAENAPRPKPNERGFTGMDARHDKKMDPAFDFWLRTGRNITDFGNSVAAAIGFGASQVWNGAKAVGNGVLAILGHPVVEAGLGLVQVGTGVTLVIVGAVSLPLTGPAGGVAIAGGLGITLLGALNFASGLNRSLHPDAESVGSQLLQKMGVPKSLAPGLEAVINFAVPVASQQAALKAVAAARKTLSATAVVPPLPRAPKPPTTAAAAMNARVPVPKTSHFNFASEFNGLTNHEINPRVIGPEQVDLLRQWMGGGASGANAAGKQLPPGLTLRTLRAYHEIARRIIAASKDSVRSQEARLKLIEDYLRTLDQ